MKEGIGKRAKPYIVAILFGVSGGLVLWYWGAPSPEFFLPKGQKARQGMGFDPARDRSGDGGREARRYASAIQSGRCDEVIAMTAWMQERLEYVRRTAADPNEEIRTREELCRKTQERRPEGNQLSLEGIEDVYVFLLDAEVEVVGVDEGRDDLEKPVEERTWLEVRYPSKFRALHDQSGYPIKSLVVGVNISADGYVLKAGFLGNLDIDFDSVSYRWETEGD